MELLRNKDLSIDVKNSLKNVIDLFLSAPPKFTLKEDTYGSVSLIDLMVAVADSL